MEDLLQLVVEHGIRVFYEDLSAYPRLLLGFYALICGVPCIVLDYRLEFNLPLHRSVLAEELGHFFTCSYMPKLGAWTSYSIQLQMDREEEKALRWACNLLMPEAQFEKAVRGYELAGEAPEWIVKEIADQFTVSAWLVYRRIHLWHTSHCS